MLFRKTSEKYTKGADKMFLNKQICSKCETGKKSFELDKHSDNCPYISCCKDGRCHYFKPLKEARKIKLFNI